MAEVAKVHGVSAVVGGRTLNDFKAALIPLAASAAERRRRVAAALEAVDLADRAHHLPSKLSGGQRYLPVISLGRNL